MAPKAREIDTPLVRERREKGESVLSIAKSLGIPESTLRFHLKKALLKVHQSTPETTTEKTTPTTIGPHKGDIGIPPLYVHPGTPDDRIEESPPLAEGRAAEPQDIPSLPLEDIPKDHQGIPQTSLSPQLTEALTTAWPDLQTLLAWWQERQRQVQEPSEKLARVTYHVTPRWIDAIKREADRTGDSYAAVVNRAFRQYFVGR